MMFRLVVLLLSFGMLLSGCFEPRCGPHQKLSRASGGGKKLASGVCVCVEGRTFDKELNCVEKAAAAPAPPAGDEPDAAAAPSGGCDMKTGLGCSCTGDADCANFQANYCVIPDPADTEMKRACLLQGCDKPGKECPALMHCCKFPFAPEKTICLPEDYECPFG